MKINNATTIDILKSLRQHVESTWTEGSVSWGTVFLDNVRPAYLNAHQFAAHLSTLEGKGLYIKCDGFFGDVNLTTEVTYGAPDMVLVNSHEGSLSRPALIPAVTPEEAFRGLGRVIVP